VRSVSAVGFSSWLRGFLAAQCGGGAVDVPCGDCNACCRAGYFVHVEPDEAATLARVPAELLFPAPGRPAGHLVMGHDDAGRCPMLVDDACAIYADRPRACRRFDCRVLSATGLATSGRTTSGLTTGQGADVGEQSRRFAFAYPEPMDREEQAAVRSALAFLRDRADCFPQGFLPSQPTQLAGLALRVHAVFARREGASDAEVAQAVMRACGVQAARQV
jgi:hypothetical protein